MSNPFPNAQLTSYTSRAVDITGEFLTKPVEDSKPITATRIDFAKTPVPHYKGYYALILDNVLSPSECTQLLSLAESSAPDATTPWQPALVNVGGGREARLDARISDRIIWDCPELVKRIIDRCFAVFSPESTATTIGGELSNVSKAHGNAEAVVGPRAAKKQSWTFTRGNERMRFLKYEAGGLFKRHTDGSYESFEDKEKGKPYERTLYTLHLYLNGDGVEGGETTFWGGREPGGRKGPPIEEKGEVADTRFDVKAVQGRVLIFQHRELLHSGEEVQGGVKYTMRTDLLYRMVGDEGVDREVDV